jgi:phosphoglycolate phosphatase-like HAD superfamily hydrolase
MKKNKIKLLIFDFDFTLVDSMKAMLRVRKDLKDLYGLAMSDRPEKIIWGSNISQNALWLKEWNHSPLSVSEIADLITKYVNIYYPKLEIIYPELFLDWMKEEKLLAVVSSCSDEALKKTFANPANRKIKFELVLQSDKNIDKSHCIEKCLSDLKIYKDEAIYIGDHTNDIQAAKKAGVLSCGITTGWCDKEELLSAEPDIVIDNLKELNKFI